MTILLTRKDVATTGAHSLFGRCWVAIRREALMLWIKLELVETDATTISNEEAVL